MCMMVASTVKLSRKFCHDIKQGIRHTHIQRCNSKRPLVYFIASDKQLKKINRRYYYLDKSMADMRCVSYKHDKWLIGKTIYLRSPMTCTCEDGVCPACYGDLAYTNAELEFSIGAYASAKLNNTLSQNILSTKHLLTTDSEEIKFRPEFYRFFVLDGYKFKVDIDSNENFENWYVRIITEDIYEFNAKEEGDFNYSIDRFFMYNKKTKENIEMKELNKNQTMYLYEDVLKMFKKSKEFEGIEMNINNIADDETYLAIFVIENNELTKPLKNIMRLLKLPSEVQQMVVDKKLTMSHVRPLLSLRDEDQIYEAAQQVLKQKMSVREVEAYVHNLSGTEVKPQKKKIHTEKDPWIRDLENRMQQKLSTGVSVSKKSITISYTDTEDLNRILDLLGCIEESNM